MRHSVQYGHHCTVRDATSSDCRPMAQDDVRRDETTYQVTYQVRPHLIQGELGADEAKGPCGPASP